MPAQMNEAKLAVGSVRNRLDEDRIATAKGLRLRFLLVFVGLAVGPILLVGFFLGQAGYSMVISQSQRSLDIRALQVRDNVRAFFERITNELATSAVISATDAPERTFHAAALQSLILRNSAYQDIYIFDDRGTVLERYSRTAATATTEALSFREEPIFKVPASTLHPHFGNIRIDPNTREPLVSLAIPLVDRRSGRLRNILMVNIRFKAIWDLLAELDHEDGVDAYVVDSSGRIVAHRNPVVAIQAVRSGVREATNVPQPITREALSARRRVDVHDMALTVVVEQELAVAHRFANRFLWTTMGVSFVAMVIALCSYLIYERGVIAPLGRLLTRVDRLRKGEYPENMDVGGFGEVGMLANSFEKLIDELNLAQIRVQKSLLSLEDKNAQLADKVEQIKASEARAEAANRAKSEFLANMSHELRTPLNAIIGFSEIMKNDLFGSIGSAKYRRYVEDIHRSGAHLLDLINDVLDLSKIESGMDELHEDDIDVAEVIQSVQTLVWERAQNAGIELVWDVPGDLPRLHVDGRKLKQILANLLTNAVKFTDAGGTVTLRARCRDKDGFVFQVIDTGVGMDPEDIPKALSQFGQVDRGRNRRHEGTGLGLPLAKSLVELHGGSLNLQTELGVGTSVTLCFPAARIIHPGFRADALRKTDQRAG